MNIHSCNVQNSIIAWFQQAELSRKDEDDELDNEQKGVQNALNSLEEI